MSLALRARIDATESFAADVTHELKNPLASLRSAVDGLGRVSDPALQAQLIAIVRDDVMRLDRLITDIADASRLDAELAREVAGRVDLSPLIGSVVDGARAHLKAGRDTRIDYHVAALPPGKTYQTAGHDLRLSQVFTNLIDNARSFVPETGGEITIRLRRQNRRIIATVEDNGPGIQAEKIDRIFERFYTDRPGAESFGQNSGLGLSISRQIVEAHGGEISAENLTRPDGSLAGARFTVSLPAED